MDFFDCSKFAFHEFQKNQDNTNFFGQCCVAFEEKVFIFGGAVNTAKYKTPIYEFNIGLPSYSLKKFVILAGNF